MYNIYKNKMSNLIEIIEPAKKKGRPKQILTPEQIQAKKVNTHTH